MAPHRCRGAPRTANDSYYSTTTKAPDKYSKTAWDWMQSNVWNSYTSTGREWDKETGLYYYRARYYDPMEGRFVTKDPIGFKGGDVNLYEYVQNNPINLKDLSGLDPYGPSNNTANPVTKCHINGHNNRNENAFGYLLTAPLLGALSIDAYMAAGAPLAYGAGSEYGQSVIQEATSFTNDAFLPGPPSSFTGSLYFGYSAVYNGFNNDN